ncbi:MAG: large subunit ribosomal protein [Candidatus Eremiobacteraeota bacterium]|jgi:ribosomal protein L7/L12|nr:large subunit ribosomal protein [Candidatus Eremiobacteraeota bacterium]
MTNGPLSDAELVQISSALYAGKKIVAIKMYREATGAGLVEAKDTVELIERTLRETEPEKFTAPQAKGCLAIVIVLLVPAAVLVLVR